MTTFELGQTVTASIQITSDGTTAADLGGGDATCQVTKPDGTTIAATVTKPGTGLYLAATPSPMAGRYRFTFAGTGANSGALPWSDVADVWPADPRFIISLADVKAELNHLTAVNDDELRLYVAATTNIVENIVGAVLTQTKVETRNGGKGAVLLSERATAITSITVDGVAFTNYVADLDAGIIYAGSSRHPYYFTPGRQNVVVTYTTGGTSVDPNVILASRIIAAHLYRVGQQAKPSRRPVDDVTVMTSGFAIPTRAAELLEATAANAMPGMA